jgi:hypothetical protein
MKEETAWACQCKVDVVGSSLIVDDMTWSSPSSEAGLLSGGREAVLVLWQLHSGHQEYVPRLGAEIEALTVFGVKAREETAWACQCKVDVVGSSLIVDDMTWSSPSGREAVLVLWQLHSGHQEYVPRLGAEIEALTVLESGSESSDRLDHLEPLTPHKDGTPVPQPDCHLLFAFFSRRFRRKRMLISLTSSRRTVNRPLFVARPPDSDHSSDRLDHLEPLTPHKDGTPVPQPDCHLLFATLGGLRSGAWRCLFFFLVASAENGCSFRSPPLDEL